MFGIPKISIMEIRKIRFKLTDHVEYVFETFTHYQALEMICSALLTTFIVRRTMTIYHSYVRITHLHF